MNVYFQTLGCKVNQYETQEMTESLLRRGYTLSQLSEADVVVVNSCTVTAESDRKVRQTVRHLKKLRENCVLVLTGCAPQAHPSLFDELPQADIVLGNNTNSALPDVLDEYLLNRRRIMRVEPHHSGAPYTGCGITAFNEHTRAFLKIQDGCNRYCSYCIIPEARGRSRSKSPEAISAEAAALAENGFCEIVLVGINLSDYGAGSDFSLPDAVEAASSPESVKRVRLGSLEPDHLTDAMLERLALLPKLCAQFHISLQSGCNKVLKAMNRHYSAEEYAALCEKLRSRFKDASITTDIITGFPGETEENFLETLDFVKKIRFEKVHVFPYSKREGTRAALMEQLENAVKDERAARLSVVADGIRRDYLAAQTGKCTEVLFERGRDGAFDGYTGNYTPVRVASETDIRGIIAEVLIDGCD
ncbi:MAG: tRNA (N(6)-L-threonylcarbamoyladenosine(37)-C(2))-methylthiotransferase MtaB, partial [Clostridiales bacterium]|nr:tRNA (N(6)-L-threonylcarbamoyladenosine(37)-C(2))-methylthiotransferase MtaB [Clostridiales bacterium]